MANPTQYQKQTDFVAISGRDQSAQLNLEFNRIAEVLNAVRENLILIQRDDTQLGNNVVHVQSLRADVYRLLSKFSPKGTWSSSISYVVGDLVSVGDSSYAVIVDHTSTASFTTDLDNDLLMRISTPVTLTAIVEEIYSNPEGVSDFDALFSLLDEVILISAAITAVNSNETNINAAVSNQTNIDLVAGSVSNGNLSTVAGNTANNNIVASLEANINTLIDNLSDILSIASTLTMTNASLEFDLDNNTPVEAVNYNTLKAAIDYALLNMQVGGTLTLNQDSSVTIAEVAALPVAASTINIIINGADKDTSIIQLFSGTEFSNNSFTATGVNLTSASTPVKFLGVNSLSLDDVKITGSVEILRVKDFDLSSSVVYINGAPESLITVYRSTGSIIDCDISSSGIISGLDNMIKADEFSRVRVGGNSFSIDSVLRDYIGVYAINNSNIIIASGNTFDGRESALYDPALDVIGSNFRSVMISGFE